MAGRAHKNLAKRFGDPLRVEVAVEYCSPAEWEDRKTRIFDAVKLGLGSILGRPVEDHEVWSRDLQEEAVKSQKIVEYSCCGRG